MHTQAIRRFRNQHAGVTLIELMVAMALGLAIIAAVGYVYVAWTQGYRVQDAQSQMQDDARFITETLSREIRMAGYFGCARQSSEPYAGGTKKKSLIIMAASQPVMTLNLDWLILGGSDTSNERFMDPGYFLRGISAATAATHPGLPSYVQTAGTAVGSPGRLPNTDVLMVLRQADDAESMYDKDVNTDGATDTGVLQLPASAKRVTGATGNNVVMVASSCQRAYIFKPTITAPTSGQVTMSINNAFNKNNNNTVSGDSDIAPNTNMQHDVSATVSQFAPSIFYVHQSSATGARPTLRRISIATPAGNTYGAWASNGGDIIASGVETFSTSYLVTTGLRTPAAVTSEKTLAYMEANPTDWENVTGVRVRFGLMAQKGNTSINTATASDGLLRQNYDFTVGIRGRQYLD